MSPIKRIMKRGHIYHVYYRRSGTYRFIGKNALKLFAVLIVLGILLYLVNKYLFRIDDITNYLTETFSAPVVLTTYFVSESTLGLLTPEIFIVWAKNFAQPWLWVLLFGTMSYVSGMVAYFIGTKLYHLPRIHRWVDETFAEQFTQIRKYGGLLIILGALTPLPYPPICIVSGVVGFSFKRFVWITLVRYVRIFLYAAIIFGTF